MGELAKKSGSETDEWKLGCFMKWRPKHRLGPCTYCNGRGEVGGGLGDLDGPRPCPECFGARQVSQRPTTPEPDLPPALVEHMRRAWWDFHNKPSAPTTESPNTEREG